MDEPDDTDAVDRLQELVADAREEGASALHIIIDGTGTGLWERREGQLRPVAAEPAEELDDLLDAVTELHGGAPMPPGLEGCRVTRHPLVGGQRLVLHLPKPASALRSLDEIGLDAPDMPALGRALSASDGLILIGGDPRSGRSSTLHALLGHMAGGDRHAALVGPHQEGLSGVTMVEPSEQTTASAVAAALDHDIDILAVDRVADADTSSMLVRAAATGVLALATVRGDTPAQMVERLQHLGAPESDIASSLLLIVTTHLLRRACRDCAVPVSPTAVQQRLLGVAADATLVDAPGCSSCADTGTAGLVSLATLTWPTPAGRQEIARSIVGGPVLDAWSRDADRVARQRAVALASMGMITLAELQRGPAAPTRGPSPHRVDGRSSILTARPQEVPRTGLPRVLVVEDDDNVRAAIRAMLDGDFAVTEVGSGRAALAALRTGPLHDVALIDKGLPDMDGYAVTREIRGSKRVRDLPVMILTGHDDPQTEMEGLRAGADDWIAKPVDPEVLAARLAALVGRRGAIHAG